MPELTDEEAIEMAVEYYERERGLKFEGAVRLVAILAKAGIIGLLVHTFNTGAIDTNAEHMGSMRR